MKKNYYYLFLFVALLSLNLQAQTISQTYTIGDIPTSYNAYSATCNGPLTTLSVGLPAGGPWEVTGFDVEYTMTAANGAYMSEQRSLVYFQNSGVPEPNVTSGTGSTEGTLSYSRSNIGIANAYYAGGTNLVFEMRAWRTWGGTLCDLFYNKVNNNSWEITVHYQPAPTCIAPQDVNVSNITVDEANVSWTEIGTSTAWTIDYGLQGYSPGTGTSVAVTSPSYLIAGLSDLTTYDVYVRSDCGPGDLSLWKGPKTFKTSADCTLYSLAITNTTPGSIVCTGTTVLTAVGSGDPNGEIYWFDAAVNGDIVGTGTTFNTPIITTTTSYWAAEVILDSGSGGTTPQTYCTPPYSTGCTSGDDIDDFIMMDAGINHIASGCSANGYGDFTGIAGLTGNMVPGEVYNFSISHNYSSQWIKIWIDLDNNGSFEDAGELLFSSLSGSVGATTGSITIPSSAQGGSTIMRVMGRWLGAPTNSCTPGGAYGETHDYSVIIGEILCESARVEVIATVTQNGDIIVPPVLPYIDANNNTSNYGNTFSGTPGNNCGGTGNFLNGYDVVYEFSPNVDAVYSVQLSGLTNNNAAVFVYESCSDIGTGCYAGAISDGTTTNFGIDEVVMYDGLDYFIVISTSDSSSTDYTLTINTAIINCADYTTAPTGDEDQFFEDGDMLDDLEVIGGNLAWYSDAAGTATIPGTTLMVDGTTYYVGQTLNGCPSDLLAITVTKINCNDLEILNTTGATIVCKGTAVLEAVANGGLGTEIFWYDALVGGDRVGMGTTFTTPELSATTSYWAAEVLIEGQAPQSGQAHVTPAALIGTTTSNGGLVFTSTSFFTIEDVEVLSTGAGGTITIDLRDIDNNNDVIATTQAVIPGGGSTTNPIPVTIPLNFDVVPGNYRLLRVTSGTTVNLGYMSAANSSFPYVLGNNFGTVTSGSLLSSTSTLYYYFFNWTIGSDQVLCESPRVEATLTVSQDGDIVIPATLPYIDANNNTANYGNTFSGAPGTLCGTTENYLNGNDVVYMFTPTADDYIDITLSDLTDFYAGMFIYESCSDIYDDCIAGVVAGPSSNNISIEEFPVTAGETYYIVISSWLSSQIGYTLEITGFVCADFPAPLGDVSQDFAAGDTIADLEVEGTRPSSTLTWYSDAGGVNVIPDTTPLVDQTTYYVGQNFNNCDSPLLAVLVSQIDCSNLDIVSTNGASVVCLGSMNLSATSSGTGSGIYWYDAATGGNLVGIGATFQTPFLTATTSYWVSEVYLESGSVGTGVLPTYCTPVHGTSGCGGGDNIDNFIMTDAGINHMASGCSTGAYGNFTTDSDLTGSLVGGQTYNFTITHTYQTSEWVKIWVDLNANGSFEDAGELLFSSTAGTAAGVTSGSITIPASVNGSTTVMRVSNRFGALPDNSCTIGGTWGETHDYKVLVIGQIICESPRDEVVATVTGDGDVVVSGLPYTTTDSTTFYGNNFSGAPGSGCSTSGNYLDGYDVVYQYTPTADDIVKIELTGVSNQNTGLFVYESCGDVGTNCVAGTTRENGLYEINDFYMTAGQSYYIVISSQAGTTSYTLNILGYDCADLDTPTGEQTQYYVLANNTIADLSIQEEQYSTGVTWYSDAAGTNQIPDTTVLVDGNTYYVSQTVLGCESLLFAITVIEFQCSDLDILSTTDDTVCGSGVVLLTAQSSGFGSEIYWYDSQTGGNLVGAGPDFSTFVSVTTEFWAAEVFLNIASGSGSGPLPTYCIPSHGGSGCSGGDDIDDFVMPSAGISHLSSGCSINDYGNFTSDSNLTGVLAAGQSYNFSATHTYQTSIYLKIWVDFNGNGAFEDADELLFTSAAGSTGGLTAGSITIPQTALAITTVMRVSVSFGAVPASACAPGGTYGETHDYKVVITGADVVCDSPREKATAFVNNTVPNAPLGDSVQGFCDDGYTVSDLEAVGSDLRWFKANGDALSLNTALAHGGVYYVTQTINTCESDPLEITVTIIDKSDIPLGNGNQTYQPGETLADLDVTGQDLTWYSDPQGNNEIPTSTPLQDVATYYVSQTMTDYCESDLLAITVHRGTLEVVDVVFAELQYYPNPVKGSLTIVNSFAMEQIELYSLLGQKLSSSRVGLDKYTLDMSDYASGAYLLKITIGDKIAFYKLVKE